MRKPLLLLIAASLAVPVAARADTFVFFKTPSGNIGCVADDNHGFFLNADVWRRF